MPKTDLTKMSSTELVEALIKDNSIASEFDRLNLWKEFDSPDWRDLLKAQPQLWIYCTDESINKIKKDPTNAKECKCWENFYSWDWLNLLSSQPQFADKCTEYNGWETFSSNYWSDLLKAQPQFADKCTKYKGWEEFDSGDWSYLLSAQPQFADKCDMRQVERI